MTKRVKGDPCVEEQKIRGTIVRIGATGAGVVLALGLFAAAPAGAAKSGKDHEDGQDNNKVTCFVPEGKTQGRSLSDPDGTSNGGADKPGCTGGFDADKDGNNGCGNDADREDDNNGNCGGKKAEGPDTPAVEQDADETKVDEIDANVQAAGSISAASTLSATTTTPAPTTVSGSSVVAPDAAETTTSTTAPDTQVLGETLSQPGTLARTGAGIGGLALLGGLLVGGGRLTVLARKLMRIG